METQTDLKEAVKMLGGIAPRERSIRGIREIVELGAVVIPAFREAMAGQHGRYGLSTWLNNTMGACQRLREANPETALGFLLRKGVQQIANDFYQAGSREYEKYTVKTTSTTVAEWYAPLYYGTLPTFVEPGTRYPEGKVQGEDSHIRNVVLGKVEAFDRVLFDDDQTAQIAKRAGMLGESMSIAKSVFTIYRFLGTARTYANLTIPASSYTTTNTAGTTITGPFSTTLYTPTAGNRPSTYGPLNVGRLKTALTAIKNAVDPLSNKLISKPDTLLVSNQDFINGDLLLAPGNYPGVLGQSSTTLANNPVLGGTSATAGTSQGALTGFPGSWMSPNPFAGMGIKLVVEPYAPDWMWAVGDSTKGFVSQQRDPMEVVQETPNSGANFDFDALRFKVRERLGIDWVGGGSRFWYLGNDGTVSGDQ